MTCSYVK